MVYLLRNLLISFALIVIVVLLIVFRTFSTLRSQEKEQERIRQSRDALQALGPAIVNMQEFESVAVSYFNTRDKKFLDDAHAIAIPLQFSQGCDGVIFKDPVALCDGK